MALGGGSWTTQNKVLPGTYISFIGAGRASSELSKRGTVAVPITLNWGKEGEVFTVTNEDFAKNSMKIFGYSYDAQELLPIRELLCNAKTLQLYRIASGGAKAACALATAKYSGIRGNDIKVAVAGSVDDETVFEVATYLGTSVVDRQSVTAMSQLSDNDYVSFKKDAELAETAGTPLTGGTNGEAPKGEDYQAFLDKMESYAFNVLCCPDENQTVIALFAAYTKRMRDEVGAKFQLVAYRPANADYEGVIGVWNKAEGTGLTYWVAGAAAACEVNKSNTNKRYDGELEVDTAFTQTELAEALKAGKLIFHRVGSEVRVLEDINTLVSFTDSKGEMFASNQTVRVCDQIANDTAAMFNTRYLGIIPNDAAGRISLWNDVCKLHQQLESIRAIENFDTKSVTVEQGSTKKSVVLTIAGVNIIGAMGQLYMSVIIE